MNHRSCHPGLFLGIDRQCQVFAASMDCFATSAHCLWAAVSDSRSLVRMLIFDDLYSLVSLFQVVFEI